jgi:hypothetical protein
VTSTRRDGRAAQQQSPRRLLRTPEEALFEMTAQKNCAHPLVNTQGKNAGVNGNIRATIINNPCAVGYPCVRFRLK